MRPPAAVTRVLGPVARESLRRGLTVYAVGGCVRDWLLGAGTKDVDLVAEADPRPLARFCARRWSGKVEAFDRFGTFRVLGPGGFRLDFVRARAESYPVPAALPLVRPAGLAEDLARRDFTVNAMAARLGPGGWQGPVDPHGGAADLRAGVVRVLHAASFRDDPTRLFRAARFCARFGFKLDPATEALLREAVEERGPGLLSRERLRAELLRVLEEKDPGAGLALLHDWGLAGFLHPALAWPENISRGRTAYERLGMMALAMDSGREFVESLHLERPVSQALLLALESAGRMESPRGALPELACRVLALSMERLPKAAAKPLLVDGADLAALGLKPGPLYKALLERAARAQWAGEFAGRAGALRWLRIESFKMSPNVNRPR